jgi:Spy/CpxP family protein refolding chaperone
VEIPIMKKLALSLGAAGAALALLAVTPGAKLHAQDSTSKPAPVSPAPAPSQTQAVEIPAEFKPLFDGITLTESQTKQISAIAQKYNAPPAAQPDSAKPGMGAGAADRRMDAAKEFRTVLTPDQQKAFDKNLDKVKGSWGKRNY